MTLRSLFQSQQLLFLAVWSLALAPALRAQAPVPPAAPAGPDTILKTDGTAQLGKILGANTSGVQIQIGATSMISLPLSVIREVRMAALPPEVAVAQRAMAAHDLPAAQTALRALEKWRGLPAEWAQQVTAMMGDYYIESGDLDKAEAAYKDFQRLYPAAQGGPQAEVGMARLSVARKQFPAAKVKLEPIAAKALGERNPPPALAYAYSQAFYLLGQIRESDGDLSGALENYLRTTTLFYADRTAVAQAQQKADALRRVHPEIFIP